MKNTLYLILAIALFDCSGGGASNFSSEQTECINASFGSDSALAILLEWEQLLIAAGDLDDNSGNSYTKLWQRFVDNNAYTIKAKHDYRLFGDKPTISPAEMKVYEVTTCFQNLPEADQVDHLVGQLDQMAAEVQALDKMTPKAVAEAMLKYVSPSQFEHPYMRYRTLVTTYCIISQDDGLTRDSHDHAH